MHVFPWSVVRDNRDAVTALMASDNFDNGFGLADSELRCIAKVREAIVALPIPKGMSQWDVVSQQILRLAGQKWSLADLAHFLAFAKSTLEDHLQLMVDIWTAADCETTLRVEPSFFGALTKVPPKYQWARTALAVAHF